MREVCRRRGGWLAGALVLAVLPASESAAGRGGALRVVETYEVAAGPSRAADVRWADDRSVYLARLDDGVALVRLESGLPRVRQVVPSRAALKLPSLASFARLAVSKEFIAWGPWSGLVGWRALARHPEGQVRFDWKALVNVEDVDLAGDRLLVLGAMYENPEEYENFAPDGAVAFLGSAREDSGQTLKPVLFDPAGPGAEHIVHCGLLGLGGTRFLADGSFFILPGFQPGAFLFGTEGNLVRSWNTALLGVDADAACEGMTDETTVMLGQHSDRRAEWINAHRVVDAVVALPAGPGVIVRSVASGKIHWELDVLGAKAVEAYEVPVPARSLRERLRADYRNGKLVVLVTEERLRAPLEKCASRLVILDLPQALARQHGGDAR